MNKTHALHLHLLLLVFITTTYNTFASEFYNNYYHCDYHDELKMDRVITKSDDKTPFTCNQFYFACREDCISDTCNSSRLDGSGYRVVEINFINGKRDFFETLKNGTGTFTGTIDFRYYVTDDPNSKLPNGKPRCEKTYGECKFGDSKWRYDYTTACKNIFYPKHSAEIKRTFLPEHKKLFVNRFMCSQNKKFKLKLQSDGNLCIYSALEKDKENFIWCSMKTFTTNSKTNLVMQDDGNLVLYRHRNSDPMWSSRTSKSILEQAMRDFNRGMETKGPEEPNIAYVSNEGSLSIGKNIERYSWRANTTTVRPQYEFTDCQ